MTYLDRKSYALKSSLKDKNNIDWDDLDMIQKCVYRYIKQSQYLII